MNATTVWQHMRRIRDAAPLVINITNYIVANTNANALLALGASPAMSHAASEITDMAAVAQAFVINIGSLNDGYVQAMYDGGKAANEHGVPVVLDPVACGVTALRRATAAGLLTEVRFAAIRGNAGEIQALAGEGAGGSRGVDATVGSESAVNAAKALAASHGCAVCVSGEIDYVTDGHTVLAISGGDAMMTAVTGMGCTATALIGAFAAVEKDFLAATAHAMAVMNVAGEMAAERSSGPGSLQMYFYDMLWTMTEADLHERLKVEQR